MNTIFDDITDDDLKQSELHRTCSDGHNLICMDLYGGVLLDVSPNHFSDHIIVLTVDELSEIVRKAKMFRSRALPKQI